MTCDISPAKEKQSRLHTSKCLRGNLSQSQGRGGGRRGKAVSGTLTNSNNYNLEVTYGIEMDVDGQRRTLFHRGLDLY